MDDNQTDRRKRALSIFDEIVELEGDARRRRIDALCGDDQDLRAQVQALLDADAGATEPVSGDARAWRDMLADAAPTSEGDATGRIVGAWRITGILGRGGMGAVYAVERADGAYVQRAALKLIRAGVDSSSARERFVRERQTLARLQHPHVAALFDGGFTSEGDPYFVMERVDGVAIDQWCDARKLGLGGRVDLFLQVLDAVQYAHRNLVVHRDLKPSNLLVTNDGQVKLLDFGIAKELQGGDLTATNDRALTFEYASPEQLHDAPITTATDIWQLGIVLHRLLSGAHPFGLGRDTPLARQLQMLESEPEPLTRAASQATREVASLRGHDPSSLAKALRGDLSSIVQGCLRRAPEDRYPSAEALAEDLRRWQEHRPLRIQPPGRWDTVKLWLRRHRGGAMAASAVALALLGGTGVASWQAHEARQQARIAERESGNARATMAFLNDTLAAASPEQALDTEVSVRQLLDHAQAKLDQRGALDPQVRQSVQRMLGRLYVSIGDPQQAVALLAAGVADVQPRKREEAIALADDLVVYSDSLNNLERFQEAFDVAEQAVALRRRFAPGDPEQELRAQAHLTIGHVEKYGLEACRQQAEKALALAKTLPDPPTDVVLDIYSDLGVAAIFQNDRQRMMVIAREGLAFAEAHHVPADHPLRLSLVRNLVNGLVMDEKLTEAENVVREGVASIERTGGNGNTSLSVLLGALADILSGQGRYREALDVLGRAQAITSQTYNGPRNVATDLSNQATVTGFMGDYAGALALSSRAMATLEEASVSPDDLFRRSLERAHAQVLLINDQLAEGEALLLDLRERSRRLDGEDAEEVALTTASLVVSAVRNGQHERAAGLLAEARQRFLARGMSATHRQFAHFLRFEARIDRLRGDLASALEHQREAVQQLEAGANPVDLAAARYELAEYMEGQGDKAEARRLLAQALPAMRDELLPQESSRAKAEALARKLGV